MKFIDNCRAKLTVLDQVRHAIKVGEKLLAVLIWLGVIDSVALQKFACASATGRRRLSDLPVGQFPKPSVQPCPQKYFA
jgi:hypothetical protein